MDLLAGQSLAVVGKSGSGKSRLLAALAGIQKPGQGLVKAHGTTFFAQRGWISARQKLATIARPTGTSAASASEALATSGLWDQRQLGPNHLSEGQLAAAELLPILSGSAAIAVIDTQLDLIDPWTRTMIWDRLQHLRKQGMILVLATQDMQTVEQCDAIVVLRDQQFRFAGSKAQLQQYVAPTEFNVVSQKRPGVRALVDPVAVKVEETDQGFAFQAYSGQDQAVKLLLEGYGDVRYVVSKKGSLKDAIGRLV